MSADSHTVCPKCHPEVLSGTVDDGILGWVAQNLGLSEDVRENIEYYLQAVGGGRLMLVFDYRADCWTCGWHFKTEQRTQVMGPPPISVGPAHLIPRGTVDLSNVPDVGFKCPNCEHPRHDGVCGYVLSQDIDDTVGFGPGEPSGEIITIAKGVCKCQG